MKNPLTIWLCEVVKKGGKWNQSECHEDRETKCGSLNEKGLIDLNTRSPASRSIREGLRGVAWLEGVCHWGSCKGRFGGFKDPHDSQLALSASCSWIRL